MKITYIDTFNANGTQIEQHFCNFTVAQCKAFFHWLLIDQFNVTVLKYHYVAPLQCRVV